MHKILTAMMIMAISTSAFAADEKKADAKKPEEAVAKKPEETVAKEDPNVKNMVIVVSTNTKTGESKATILHHEKTGANKDADHNDHAATLFNWSGLGSKIARGASKGASLAVKHQDKLLSGLKTGVGLAQAGVGIASAAGAKINTNDPAYIAFNIGASILNGDG